MTVEAPGTADPEHQATEDVSKVGHRERHGGTVCREPDLNGAIRNKPVLRILR